MRCHAGHQWRPRLLIALSPIYVWLAAITALPHKEERFMYVVYPLVRFSFTFMVDINHHSSVRMAGLPECVVDCSVPENVLHTHHCITLSALCACRPSSCVSHLANTA